MQLYFTMPKPGETIREGSIVKWLKHPNDSLNEKDPLVELETEKAVFTADSPFRGKLKQILVKENESVKVGTPLALFEVSKEDGEKYLMLGIGIPAEKKEEIIIDKITEVEVEKHSTSNVHFQTSYSPLVRKLAKEYHLDEKDLEKIPRKRTGERLTKEDVLQYVESEKFSSSFQFSPTKEKEKMSEYELVPVTPIRHRIAEHLKKSHHEIPQAATSVDVDMTSIMEFRKKKNVKFSPFHFFAYAVRELLKKNPLFNSNYFEENGKAFIRKYKNIHLAFAVATKQGLFNPVIHRAENLNFQELVSKISELENKAKEGKLSIDELTGATFLVNNPGALGGSRSYQLIPHPLVAIIGLNKIQKKPWVIENQIIPRDIATIDLSFDHRVVDGAEAIQFAEETRKILENFPFDKVIS